MWLLPPDFPLRPLRLAPDRRALPWYATEHEIEQLMELLRRLVPEIKEWVRVPWSALERVSGRSEVREGAALVVESPKELDEAAAREMVSRVRWPYVFWRPQEPSEEQGAWLEREVKRALLSELRQGLASEEHPLRAVGIERLPVDLAAAATDDPVELLAIVQGAVTHRLAHVDEGTRVEDWSYSVKRAIGEQLAKRLGRVEGKALTRVLEVVLSEGRRPVASEARSEACERLQAIGLGLRVVDSIALGPLARSANESVVYGVLLERLPTKHWPRDEDGQRFLSPPSRPSSGALAILPVRIAGPNVIHYPKLVLETMSTLEGIAKELAAGGDVALRVLRAAWLHPVFFNLLCLPAVDAVGEAIARDLRLLDQHRFESDDERSFVELLRAVFDAAFVDGSVEVDAHLRRIATLAAGFDDRGGARAHRGQPIAPGIELFAAFVALSRCQDHQRLRELLDHAVRKEQGAREQGAREHGYDRAWRGLAAEAHRLMGRSALAARGHEAANVFHPELYPQAEDRRVWNQARAFREAGYDARAHELLIRLQGKERKRVLRPLQPDVALELGLVELDRGSPATARTCFEQARASVSGNPAPSLTTLYAEAYDVVARLVEGVVGEAEPRLTEIASQADEHGEVRLAMLVDVILGDLLLCTDRFDGARRRYSAAREKALRLGDQLALACTYEKTALLEERLGRDREALAELRQGSELDIATAHHDAAVRQLHRAVGVARKLELSDQVEALGARIDEMQRASREAAEAMKW